MSLTVCCYFVNGIRFCPEDAIVKVPNPLWGKCKFDPETGKKVGQFVEDKSKYKVIMGIVEKMNSNESTTIYDRMGDNDQTFRTCFVGDVTSVRPWEGANWTKVDVSTLPNMNMEFAKFNDLKCLLDDAGVKYERGYFLVQYVG